MQDYTPLEYIKIDISNHYGLDKELFETRIGWVDQIGNDLEQMTSNADDKPRYSAAVMALREVQAGNPIGHLVGLDACASGPQIMSAFMRCEIGAENTNLIGKVRNDVYGKATTVMNALLNTSQVFDRGTIKYALMPHYYGSKARPKMAFGKDTPELVAFYEAQATVCPGAAILMPIMIDSWQSDALEHCWTMVDGYEVRVKVTNVKESKIEVDELDHATFTYQYTVNEGAEDGVANAANIIQSTDGFIVRELCRRCNYNGAELSRVRRLLKKRSGQKHLNGVELDSIQTLWMEHNFLSLVDAGELTWEEIKKFDFNYTDQLITLIDRCMDRPSFPVITIHDEFKCHPNYMNYVRQTYIELLAEISESTMIDAILSEITGKKVIIKKLADSISDLILKSEYPLS